MGCLSSIVKYLLFLTNFLVFALGIMMLTFSVMAYVDGGVLSDLISMADSTDSEAGDIVLSVFTTASILIMVISCLVVIVSFFGCCGAIKESKCLLSIYIMIIIAFLAAFIAGAVLGYQQDSNVIKKPLFSTLVKYDPTGTEDADIALVKAWDTIQTEFVCCGVDSLGDWKTNNTAYPAGVLQVPASCCEDRDTVSVVETCQKDPTNADWIEDLPGCFTKLKDFFDENQNYILYGCIGIILVLILNMAAAFAVCCKDD